MTILAIYENGVFRPIEPVDLPEHTQVTVRPAGGDAPPKKEMTVEDLARFRGTLKSWPEDPVAGQRRVRDEEWL